MSIIKTQAEVSTPSLNSRSGLNSMAAINIGKVSLPCATDLGG